MKTSVHQDDATSTLGQTKILNRLWQLTEKGAWRAFSLTLTLVVLLSGTYALYLGVQAWDPQHAARPMQSRFHPGVNRPSYAMSIPVRYLPNLILQEHPDGTSKVVREYGRTTIEVPSHEVALVMVDLWDGSDPPSGIEPEGRNKNIKNFLEKCRLHGVTIIHAPNHPVVGKYKQYYDLRAEVNSYLGRYDYPHTQLIRRAGWRIGNYYKEVLYQWPPADLSTEYQDIRIQGRAAAYKVRPKAERDISRFFKPRPDEFVLVTSDEFRYALWIRKIKVLIYVGGATNECMLHRPTGINRLAGMDDERSNFVIVVMGDCSNAIQSLWCSDDAVDRVMLDYMMTKIAFVGNSAEVEWN